MGLGLFQSEQLALFASHHQEVFGGKAADKAAEKVAEKAAGKRWVKG